MEKIKTIKSKNKNFAVITNLQRFSVHDGTGIRTLIFFKGCPLECAWCSNPETQSIFVQVMQTKINCLHCFKCIDSCPKNALELKEGIIVSDPFKCDLCGDCEIACPTNNINLVGKEYNVDELTELILKDKVFYKRTNGGVTYSGGEPTVQLDFLIELSKNLKANDINIAIETCGFFNINDFRKLLPYLDIVYFDLKVIDDNLHQNFTGKSNKKIIDNLKKLKSHFDKIVIRFPLIPDYTDTKQNVEDIIKLLKEIGITRIDILPYHRLGERKYIWLNVKYALAGLDPKLALDKADEIKKVFKDAGLTAMIGG